MKKHPGRHRRTPRVSPSVLERITINVAGIDCGSAEHFVAVPPDRDPAPVHSFTTFTSDLHRLADWLTVCRVTSVAMEATGVYWIPLYEILEARGFDVVLVNAKHVKNVPGRKSDVLDSEWLRELHSVGLLRGSFRPVDAIVALRAYLRHRETLVQRWASVCGSLRPATMSRRIRRPVIVHPWDPTRIRAAARVRPWSKNSISLIVGYDSSINPPFDSPQESIDSRRFLVSCVSGS
jgi:hypothetical protein